MDPISNDLTNDSKSGTLNSEETRNISEFAQVTETLFNSMNTGGTNGFIDSVTKAILQGSSSGKNIRG